MRKKRQKKRKKRRKERQKAREKREKKEKEAERLGLVFGTHAVEKKGKQGKKTLKEIKKDFREKKPERFLVEGETVAGTLREAKEIEEKRGKLPPSYWEKKIPDKEEAEFRKKIYELWKETGSKVKPIESRTKKIRELEKESKSKGEILLTRSELEEYKNNPRKREELKKKALERMEGSLESQANSIAERDKKMADLLSMYGAPEEEIKKLVKRKGMTEKEAKEFLGKSVAFVGSAHSNIRRRLRDEGVKFDSKIVQEGRWSPVDEYVRRKSLEKVLEDEIEDIRRRKEHLKRLKGKKNVDKKKIRKKDKKLNKMLTIKQKRKNEVLNEKKKKELAEKELREELKRIN